MVLISFMSFLYVITCNRIIYHEHIKMIIANIHSLEIVFLHYIYGGKEYIFIDVWARLVMGHPIIL